MGSLRHCLRAPPPLPSKPTDLRAELYPDWFLKANPSGRYSCGIQLDLENGIVKKDDIVSSIDVLSGPPLSLEAENTVTILNGFGWEIIRFQKTNGGVEIVPKNCLKF